MGLVYKAYVIQPQRIAGSAHIGAAIAAVELQDKVGGFLVGLGPSLFDDFHILTLRQRFGLRARKALRESLYATTPAFVNLSVRSGAYL